MAFGSVCVLLGLQVMSMFTILVPEPVHDITQWPRTNVLSRQRVYMVYNLNGNSGVSCADTYFITGIQPFLGIKVVTPSSRRTSSPLLPVTTLCSNCGPRT